MKAYYHRRMKPYDETAVGKLVRFTAEGVLKQGRILAGEFAHGVFLGYTVWVEPEQTNYVRVKQFQDNRWEMVPVT